MTTALDPWALALDLLEGRSASAFGSPAEVARSIDPRTVETPALALITDALVNLWNTPNGRLAISMPPQEGKTTRALRDFVVWALTQDPDCRVIVGTYNQFLAGRNGRMIRNAIEAHPELGLTIATDNGAKHEWSIAGHEGGVVSAGRGVGVSGRAADLVVIDDPFKEGEAASETIREDAWEWWEQGITARFGADTKVVVIHTRWHQDDLIGRLLERDAHAGWTYLNIPAECIDPDSDPLGRSRPGEFMVSARGRTEEQWTLRKRSAGSRTWNALYQGRPSPADGDLFKRDAWRYFAEYPNLSGVRIIQSWDLAFTGSKKSDFCVGQVWAHAPALGRFYLLDQVRGRWSFTEQIDQMVALSAKWPAAVQKLVEAKANGNAAIDLLTARGVTGLVPITPKDGKTFRAEVVSPLQEAHNVILPAPTLAPWVGEFVEECASFPNAANDDQVDAMSQALAVLAIPAQQSRGWSNGFVNMG